MSFGQALILPSFSTMVGQDCHLLRQGIHTLALCPVAAMSCGQALTLPSFSTPNKGMADSTMRPSSDGDAAR